MSKIFPKIKMQTLKYAKRENIIDFNYNFFQQIYKDK